MPYPCALVAGLLLAAVSARTAAQSVATDPGIDRDQRVVLSRTVHPRIAYRGLPAQENPVHARATVFPGQVFHTGIDGFTDLVVDDSALALTLSVGSGSEPASTATANTGAIASDLMAGGAGPSRVPLGAGAAVGMSLGGLGRGLDTRINGLLVAPVGGGR